MAKYRRINREKGIRRSILAGLTKHCHMSLDSSFNIRISIAALVPSLIPYNLAGITLVSFITLVKSLMN